MPRSSFVLSPIIRVPAILLVLALYAISGVNALWMFGAGGGWQRQFMNDLRLYMNAVEIMRMGSSPYFMTDMGYKMIYPPPALLVLELFALIPEGARPWVMIAANVALLGALVFAVFRRYRAAPVQAWGAFALALFFAPFLILCLVGQVNMIILAGLLLVFLYASRRPLLAGLGLSLGIILKISPLILCGYLLVTRRWKALFSTLALVALFALAAGLRYGFDLYAVYPAVFRHLAADFGAVVSKQGLVAKMVYFAVITPEQAAGFQFGLLVYFGVVLALAAGLYWLTRREALFFAVCVLAMNFYPNQMWYHHYVFFLLPLLILLGEARFRPLALLGAAITLLVTQMDPFYLTTGLLIHVIAHLTIWGLLIIQAREALSVLRARRAAILSTR